LLNVGIDVAILGVEAFNEIMQTLINGDLKLLVIVRILHDLVHRVLQTVDISLIFADYVPVGCNGFGYKSLAHSQVFNHHTKVSIDRVVLFQSLIHDVGSLL